MGHSRNALLWAGKQIAGYSGPADSVGLIASTWIASLVVILKPWFPKSMGQNPARSKVARCIRAASQFLGLGLGWPKCESPASVAWYRHAAVNEPSTSLWISFVKFAIAL